jgi:hypothetical protein
VAGLVVVGGIVLWALRQNWLSRFGSSVDADSELADELELGYEPYEDLARAAT